MFISFLEPTYKARNLIKGAKYRNERVEKENEMTESWTSSLTCYKGIKSLLDLRFKEMT